MFGCDPILDSPCTVAVTTVVLYIEVEIGFDVKGVVSVQGNLIMVDNALGVI